MEIKVQETRATSWEGHELGLSKQIVLRTSIGQREHIVSLSYHPSPKGTFAALLIFTFNFEVSPGSGYVVIDLTSGEQEGAWGAFHLETKDGQTTLSTDDPDAIKRFITAFCGGGWLASIRGKQDILCQFPVPADERFEPELLAVYERLDSSRPSKPNA